MSSKKKNFEKTMEDYYKNLHTKFVLDYIFKGSPHNSTRIREEIKKFKEDKRTGKIK